jgi:hypothetical protein
MGIVEKGQNEIKELIKHTTTRMTESFTYFRKDMNALALDVNSMFSYYLKKW